MLCCMLGAGDREHRPRTKGGRREEKVGSESFVMVKSKKKGASYSFKFVLVSTTEMNIIDSL